MRPPAGLCVMGSNFGRAIWQEGDVDNFKTCPRAWVALSARWYCLSQAAGYARIVSKDPSD